MKKETVVKVPPKKAVAAKPATTKTVVRYTCDVCGKAIDRSLDNRYGSGMSKCSLCGRDVCRTQVEGKYGQYTCFDFDPDEMGDYPDKYCIICFPLYIPVRNALKEKHWKAEEALENKVKKESLNYGKTQSNG